MKQDPYQIIKHQHVTEKSTVLENLKTADANPCLKRCKSPKYVFIVDTSANKQQIAQALEEIYSDKKIKVVDVNTINVKGKQRRVRGRLGMTKSFKKAIVTLEPGDSIDVL
ncbi:MAG: 50S ribosomal protein L23 [Parachlamydiaceae bacterium]